MKNGLCDSLEEVRQSRELSTALAIMNYGGKFQNVEEVTQNISTFRAALARFARNLPQLQGLQAQGQYYIDPHLIDQPGQSGPSLQVKAANAERLIMCNQLDGVVNDKDYTTGKLAQFLVEALDAKEAGALKKLCELGREGMNAYPHLFKPFRPGCDPEGVLLEAMGSDRENAKKIIAASLLTNYGEISVNGLINNLLREGIIDEQDGDFAQECMLFEKVKELAWLIELSFKRVQMSRIPGENSRVEAARLFGEIMRGLEEHHRGPRLEEFINIFNKFDDVVKEILVHLIEKDYLFTDDFPIVMKHGSGTNDMQWLMVRPKNAWIRPDIDN
jgi:hypothetical protein